MSNNQIIGQAIVFIENNLYEPIVACDVAKAVTYSYYHFHRYFSAVMGETIGSYIRNRRLTQAAWELVHSEKRVTDIAFSLHFETVESFTRAFKNRYFLTPTAYRKNGIDVLIGYRKSAQDIDNTIVTHLGLSPEIVTVPVIYIMGFRFKTTINGNESVGKWQQFNSQIPKSIYNNHRYGIYEAGETCSPALFNLDSETTAFVGVEVPVNYPILKDMEIKKLSGGKYAKFIHKGTVNTLIQTYHYIWGIWFPKSGFSIAHGDDFECYTELFLGADDEKSEIDIYFPIT